MIFYAHLCIYVRKRKRERERREACVHARCSSFTSRWYGGAEYIYLYMYIGDTVSPCNELCHRDSCANRDVHVCDSAYTATYVTQ